MAKKKNAAAVALRKLGTPEGARRAGKARMAVLTPAERRALGRKAAAARWGKR
jgi:hypothetical protein